jgi:hypothetical protein
MAHLGLEAIIFAHLFRRGRITFFLEKRFAAEMSRLTVFRDLWPYTDPLPDIRYQKGAILTLYLQR